MHTNTYNSSTKAQFYEFLVVMCCISINMQILQSLLIFKIFIIKIAKDSLSMSLVLNSVFITVYHVKAVRDDISTKPVPI